MADVIAELRAKLACSERDYPLPWQWWTSNSFRRLTSATGKDGDVAWGYASRHDGHGDIAIEIKNQELIAAAVNALPALLDVAEAARELEEVLCTTPVGASAYHELRERRYETRDALRAALARLEGRE